MAGLIIDVLDRLHLNLRHLFAATTSFATTLTMAGPANSPRRVYISNRCSTPDRSDITHNLTDVGSGNWAFLAWSGFI